MEKEKNIGWRIITAGIFVVSVYFKMEALAVLSLILCIFGLFNLNRLVALFMDKFSVSTEGQFGVLKYKIPADNQKNRQEQKRIEEQIASQVERSIKQTRQEIQNVLGLGRSAGPQVIDEKLNSFFKN